MSTFDTSFDPSHYQPLNHDNLDLNNSRPYSSKDPLSVWSNSPPPLGSSSDSQSFHLANASGLSYDDNNNNNKNNNCCLARHRRYRYCCGGCILSRLVYFGSLCFIFSIIAVVTGVIFLYAIVPSLVKSAVSGSNLNFQLINITDPHERDVKLVAQGTIDNTGPFAATLDSMTLHVAHVIPSDPLNNRPQEEFELGSLVMAPLYIQGPTSLKIDTRLVVSNLTSFNRFVRSLIFEDKINWHMAATASVTPEIAGIKLPKYENVAFDKYITLGACGGLLDVKLEVFKLDKSTVDQVIIDMKVKIGNPSIFNIMPLGNLHFDIFYQNVKLGPIYATNASLFSGYSEIPMYGLLQPENLLVANDLVNRFLIVEDTDVTAVAATDASSISLYNTGMEGLSLATTLKGNTINLLASMTFNSMTLNPLTLNSPLISLLSNVSLVLDSPLGLHSPVIVHNIEMNATLYYKSYPIGVIRAPNTPAYPVFTNPNETITFTFASTVEGFIDISNFSEGYSLFVHDFLQANSITLSVFGLANVNATYALGPIVISGFPLNISTSLNGMSGLSNTTVLGLQMPRDYSFEECSSLSLPFPCGVMAVAQATVVNPSSTVVHLGQEAALSLNYKNVNVGLVHAVNSYNENDRIVYDGLSISPGLNYVNLSGLVSISGDSISESTAGELFSNFLQGISSTISLRGAMTGNGAQALTVNGLDLSTPLYGPDANLISDIQMKTLGMDLSDPSLPITTAAADVSFKLPSTFSFPVNITKIAVLSWIQVMSSVSGLYERATFLDNPLTDVNHVHAPPGSGSPDNLYFNVNAPMKIYDETLFSTFVSSLLLTPSATVLFNCSANTIADASFGSVSMPNVKAIHNIALQGFNSFADSHTGESLMKVHKIDISAGFANGSEWGAGYAVMTVSVSLLNPANVYMYNAGDLTFQLRYQGEIMGIGTMSNFQMQLGDNSYNLQGYWAPPPLALNQQLSREFLSAYLNGIDKNVTVHGSIETPQGTKIPGSTISYLQPAVSLLVTHLTIPGLDKQTMFFQKFGMKLSPSDYINILIGKVKIIPTQVTVYNPFSTDLLLTGGNLTVILGAPDSGKIVGSWNEDRSNNPVLINKNGYTNTPLLPVLLDGLHLDVVEAFLQAIFAGSTPISCVGPLHGVVGGSGGWDTFVDIVAPSVPGALI